LTGLNIVAGLDVGTTKVCAVVAELNEDGLNILGVGRSNSSGVRKGIIVNMDATVDSIKKAVKEAESFSGTRIRSVFSGISGGHISGFESFGSVGIGGEEVDGVDVERAIESAKAVYVPLDREVLHVIPMEFVLDGHEGIIDPIGMAGARLGARVNIITGAVVPVKNLVKCCAKSDLDVAGVILKPLASAYSTLTPEEKKTGVVLIDIGGGTTDIVLFRDSRPRHVSVLGVGGAHITNDIAVGLGVDTHEAERLKQASGVAVMGIIEDGQAEVRMTQYGGRGISLPVRHLLEIIQPRCEEILQMIKAEIRAWFGPDRAAYGIVLTGGTSLLRGFDKMAESVLGLPVRVGMPLNTNGMRVAVDSPVYSSCVGFLNYIDEQDFNGSSSPEIIGGAFGRMKDWVKDYSDRFFRFK